ncbi:hypothetical protein [Paenibacillus agilis]|uniref:Uncharacterized protein n=1 Tax=Paenibacillus agilis TaxID=3020863 RepID=A0A559ID42_9BACL|nr:hypothetical protein [Paenibacillus agilis]TVX85554.1 hypothetical protein FPZ44_24670 [Paenibacillus agilis]
MMNYSSYVSKTKVDRLKLTAEQQAALQLLANAYDLLTHVVWTDELGEFLNDRRLLPMRDLTDAEAECRYYAISGLIDLNEEEVSVALQDTKYQEIKNEMYLAAQAAARVSQLLDQP